VILGNHHDPNNPGDDIIESNQRWKVIPSGKIRSTGTKVTTAEVALIKIHTVQCKILLVDPATQKEVAVVGSPQLIIDTP